MARKKKLPTYPVGTRVHVKFRQLELDCAGVVVGEPVNAYDTMWSVDVGDAPFLGRENGDDSIVALDAEHIVSTLPADDSVESIMAWLRPETVQ